MHQDESLFSSIREIVSRIDAARREPNFTTEWERRRELRVMPLNDDRQLLRHLAHIMAYARADSVRVTEMIKSGQYDEVWLDYDVERVARLNPCNVVEDNWEKINPIMSGAKAYFLIMAARSFLALEGGAASLFNRAGLPERIFDQADLDEFWRRFDALRAAMKKNGIPYLGNITSLSHFLLSRGYDCIKPDVIVMSVAGKLGLANDKKESTLKKVAKKMQQYALAQGIRPSEIDMYLLIQGQQEEAKSWVKSDFVPQY
jgi:hypothetical protein